MSRLSRFNVVFLAANAVAAAVLGIALWRMGSAEKPANAPTPGGGHDARAAAARSGAGVTHGVPSNAGFGNAGSVEQPDTVAGAASPPAPKDDGGPGMDWSLRARSGGSSGASRHATDSATPVPGKPDAVPSAPASAAARGAASANPASGAVRSGTIIPGASVTPSPPGSQPPAPSPRPSPSPEPSPPPDPTSDRTPPVLDSLAFNPPQIADGAATTLLIGVHDDLSGVKRVTGNLRSPSGAAIISFEGQGDAGGVVFAATIPIPKQAETGNWFVTNLFISDRADNTLVGTYTAATTPAGGSLRVVSSQSDNTAPEVRGATLDKMSVKDGEADVIHVDVQDDVSGVATVTGVFQSPTKTAFIPFTCRAGPDGSTWDGPFTVPGNASCGEWTIQQLRVSDKAGNIATVPGSAPQLANAGFLVTTQGDCDSTAPTLDAFSMSPTVVSNEAASPIAITAQVHDDGTGTISVTGWAAGPVSSSGQTPQISFALSRRASDPQDVWTGQLVVPQYAAKGTWKIGRIRVQDKALNTRDYTANDPVLMSATFYVQ